MNYLTIKHTITGIGQTGIDLARCARFQTTKTEKIAWGLGVSAAKAATWTLNASEGFPLGVGITIGAGVVGSATLGCTILGLYGARQKAPWTGALGGALVGITATGCTILAAPILGGSPVGLTSSAALLGIGGTGGALLAIATSLAAKSGGAPNNKYLLSCMGIGFVAGVLLGKGVAEGLLCGLPTTGEAIVSSGMIVLTNTVVSEFLVEKIILASQSAEYKDNHLARMIRYKHLYSEEREFEAALQQKLLLSPINLSGKSISYNELLHKIIDKKAPPKWFEMLLKQPGINPNLKNDQGQTPAHSIVQKVLTSTSEDSTSEDSTSEDSTSEDSTSEDSTSEDSTSEKETIYLEYLKYLLLDEVNSKLTYKTILEIVKSHQLSPNDSYQNNNFAKIYSLLLDIDNIRKEQTGDHQNQQTTKSYLYELSDIKCTTEYIKNLTEHITERIKHITPLSSEQELLTSGNTDEQGDVPQDIPVIAPIIV